MPRSTPSIFLPWLVLMASAARGCCASPEQGAKGTAEDIIPETFLPKAESIHGGEQQYRLIFWVAVHAVTWAMTLVIGTRIMTKGVRSQSRRGGGSGTPGEVDSATLRRHTLSVFIPYYCVVVGVTFWSVQTARISVKTGLAWELYWIIFTCGCAWMVAQGCFVLRYKVTGNTDYSWTVFGEATILALVPFIADPADTLKDVIFGGLCLLSEEPLLHVLGVVSWIYILVVHAVMVRSDDTLMELVPAYLGVYHAPVKSQGSENGGGKTMKVLALLYKQTTASKRWLIALEDGPQTAMALIYAVFEQPDPFVVLMNVLLPVLRYLFAVMLNGPLRRQVRPWLQDQLDQAIADKNVAKVVALCNSLMEEVDGDQALQLGMQRAFETLAFQAADRIAQILIQHDKLKNLKLDMQKSPMDAEGATSLGASLEKLKGFRLCSCT